MAAAWVLGSTLDEIRRRGPTPGAAPSLLRAMVLVGWIALGVALALQGGSVWAPKDVLRMLYGVFGLLAVVLPVAVLVPDREPVSQPSTPESP
jgi:hypothetical protein